MWHAVAVSEFGSKVEVRKGVAYCFNDIRAIATAAFLNDPMM